MLNKVQLIGNLGKNPEAKTTEGTVKVLTISVATNETYTNKSGEKVTNTEWHNVVLWRNLAEIADKYAKKGTLVYVEGKLKTRSWEDKDNKTHYTTEVVADTFKILANGKEKDSQAEGHENTDDMPA